MALTMTPTTRQPFASLDAPRMRSILRSKMNLKNQRDGLLASTSKRQPLSVMDAENIDPVTRLAAKRKRTCDEDDDGDSLKAHGPSKPIKASRMALAPVEANPPPRKSVSTTPTTPRKPLQATPCKSTPSIKPLGRSPQPTPRRSTIAKQPSGPASRRSVKRPFSIATALSGGKSKAPAVSGSSAKPVPASWAFDIHVDSEQEELTNLMQHSTCVLDISDDERKADDAVDAGRGKENIPPAELGLTLASPAPAPATTRKELMLDEPRAPLGELNASDYYPDGCHAFSYEVVYEDGDGDEENVPVAEVKPSRHQRSRSKLSSVSSIAAILDATAPKDAGEPKEESTPGSEPAEVEIWESESAAEENAE